MAFRSHEEGRPARVAFQCGLVTMNKSVGVPEPSPASPTHMENPEARQARGEEGKAGAQSPVWAVFRPGEAHKKCQRARAVTRTTD